MTATKATIVTNMGTIELELWPERAPKHVENLKSLADKGFYDNLIFHRVIDGFMIQGGCPDGTGMGGPGFKVDAEFNDAPFAKGVLGMARSQDPNSAGSQFFICIADAPHLTGQYTAFGCVTVGQDIADQIGKVPATQDRPHTDVTIESLKVS